MKTIAFYLLFLFAWQSVTAQATPDNPLSKSFDLWNKITSANLKKQQRSPQTLKEALDSIVYYVGYVQKFTYDTQGNQLTDAMVNYDNNGAIDYGDMTEYSYNAQNILTEILLKEWDNNTWVETDKYEINYDNQNRISEILFYGNDNSTWVLTDKAVYEYDTNNQLISIIFSELENSNWVFQFKRALSWSASGKVTEIIDYNWNGSDWAPDERKTFEYDTSGRLITYISWRYENNDWEANYKKDLEYDASTGELDKMYFVDWDPYSQNWYVSYRGNYIYDANNALVEIIYEDNNSSNWEVTDKQVLTSDFNYPSGTLLLPDFNLGYEMYAAYEPYLIELSLYFRYKLLNMAYMEYDSGTWTIYENYDFYWSTMDINAAEELILKDVSVAPNPADEYIQILNVEKLHQAELSIFDTQGKKVYQGPANGNIDVSGLSKGIYIYKIQAQEGIKTGKFIIR